MMIKKIILSLLVLLAFASCDPKEDLLPPDTLSVTRFEPLAALSNDTIYIYGSGFSTNAISNVVEFTFPLGSGTVKSLATVIHAEESKLQVIVPGNILSGRVKVAVGPYSALSDVPFLLSPSISSVNPQGGLPGDQITVQGKNFPTNLNQLLLYIGDVEIESIFGGSSTQIIFPLPEGLAPGLTILRVGVLLTPEDSVFAPPAIFTVFDPNQPAVSSISPESNIPGGEITLSGNAFKVDGGTTLVTFTVDGQEFIVQQADLITLQGDKIVVKIPAAIDVEGKGEVEAFVTVSVTPAGAPALVSEPMAFTILEPSDVVFYYTAFKDGINPPKLYRAEPTGNGNALTTEISGADLGVDSDVSNAIYFSNGGTVQKIGLSGGSATPVNIESYYGDGDISVNTQGGELYFFDIENKLIKHIIATQVNSILKEDYKVTHIKNDNGKVYWTGKKTFGTTNIGEIFSDLPSGTFATSIYSQDIGIKFLTGLAISSDKIYFVVGPTSSNAVSITAGNSTLYSINKDGSGTPNILLTRNSTSITDLELSEDGKTLYWMEASDVPANGALKSILLTNPLIISTVVSNIHNGRYFDVLEMD